MGSDLIIGAWDVEGVTQFGNFEIAELIIFKNALSDEDLTSIEGFIAHKWGLENSLPLAHPYSQEPPTFENRPEILFQNPTFLSLGTSENLTIPTSRLATDFDANNLPSGMELNRTSGLLHGTPSRTGIFNSTLSASNDQGTLAKDIDFIVNDFTAWKYSLDINISGFEGTEAVYNFPLYLEFNDSISGFHYDQFSDADGRDLRFIHSQGAAEIPYEIIKWNEEGVSAFWLLLPRLDSNSSITAIWGNPDIHTRPEYCSDGSVWENYRAVWKMDNDSNH